MRISASSLRIIREKKIRTRSSPRLKRGFARITTREFPIARKPSPAPSSWRNRGTSFSSPEKVMKRTRNSPITLCRSTTSRWHGAPWKIIPSNSDHGSTFTPPDLQIREWLGYGGRCRTDRFEGQHGLENSAIRRSFCGIARGEFRRTSVRRTNERAWCRRRNGRRELEGHDAEEFRSDSRFRHAGWLSESRGKLSAIVTAEGYRHYGQQRQDQHKGFPRRDTFARISGHKDGRQFQQSCWSSADDARGLL